MSGDDDTNGNLPLLILNLSLNIIDGVRRFDLEGYGLASKSLHKDLHGERRVVVRMKCEGNVDGLWGKRSDAWQRPEGTQIYSTTTTTTRRFVAAHGAMSQPRNRELSRTFHCARQH